MKKMKRISINESQLRRIVKGSVKRVLMEEFEDEYDSNSQELSSSENNDDNSPFVDLGLPSGKLWMRHMVGMKTDTDIQNALYFQWGAEKGYRRTKHDCLKHYDYSKTEWNLFKDGVKIPSREDFKELLENTKHKRETIDGVRGMRLISKTNGKSIFIPFIGNRSCLGSVIDVGYDVGLWSSSIDVSNPGYAIQLHLDVYDCAYVSYYPRYDAFGVLGVL